MPAHHGDDDDDGDVMIIFPAVSTLMFKEKFGLDRKPSRCTHTNHMLSNSSLENCDSTNQQTNCDTRKLQSFQEHLFVVC